MIVNHVPGMQKMAGQTVDCFGRDTTGSVQYTFNSQGFRSSYEFDSVPVYAFFGCSLVFGIGVDQRKIASSQFANSHNYGLAGVDYSNHDIAQLIQKYLQCNLYSPTTKIIVVWHSIGSDMLDNFYHHCPKENFFHFFCGQKLKYHNCYSAPKNLDSDVSGTHMGPLTHDFFAQTVRSLCRSI